MREKIYMQLSSIFTLLWYKYFLKSSNIVFTHHSSDTCEIHVWSLKLAVAELLKVLLSARNAYCLCFGVYLNENDKVWPRVGSQHKLTFCLICNINKRSWLFSLYLDLPSVSWFSLDSSSLQHVAFIHSIS